MHLFFKIKKEKFDILTELMFKIFNLKNYKKMSGFLIVIEKILVSLLYSKNLEAVEGVQILSKSTIWRSFTSKTSYFFFIEYILFEIFYDNRFYS